MLFYAVCCVFDGNDHERHFSTFLFISLSLSLHLRFASRMVFIYRFFLRYAHLAHFEALPNETISKLPFVHRVFFGFYFWLLLSVIKGNFVSVLLLLLLLLPSQKLLPVLTQLLSPFVRFDSPSSRFNHMSYTILSLFSLLLFLIRFELSFCFPHHMIWRAMWKSIKVFDFAYLDLTYCSI